MTVVISLESFEIQFFLYVEPKYYSGCNYTMLFFLHWMEMDELDKGLCARRPHLLCKFSGKFQMLWWWIENLLNAAREYYK